MGSAYSKLKVDYAKCDTITFTNGTGSTINGGTMKVEAKLLGMVLDDVANGEDGVLIVGAPPPGLLVPKEATTVTFANGERVYWDVADDELNDDGTNNGEAGYAVAAAGATDAEVQIALTNVGLID